MSKGTLDQIGSSLLLPPEHSGSYEQNQSWLVEVCVTCALRCLEAILVLI